MHTCRIRVAYVSTLVSIQKALQALRNLLASLSLLTCFTSFTSTKVPILTQRAPQQINYLLTCCTCSSLQHAAIAVNRKLDLVWVNSGNIYIYIYIVCVCVCVCNIFIYVYIIYIYMYIYYTFIDLVRYVYQI